MLTLTSPVDTPAHRLPAGVKLAALCALTLLLFRLHTPLPLAWALAALVLLALSFGRGFAASLARSLASLWPFALILALWHLWTGDLTTGLTIGLRMFAAVGFATLVTMTTPLSQMLALFQRLAAPLARLGINPKALAMAIALMIRFIPVMLDRFAQLSTAWRARSARRIGWQLILPATMAALDDASQVADALRARGGTAKPAQTLGPTPTSAFEKRPNQKDIPWKRT